MIKVSVRLLPQVVLCLLVFLLVFVVDSDCFQSPTTWNDDRWSHRTRYQRVTGLVFASTLSKGDDQQQKDKNKNTNIDELLLRQQEDYESYSRTLSPKAEREKILTELEKESIIEGPGSFIQRVFRYQTSLRQKLFQRTQRRTKNRPGKLVLIRCGESELRANGTFTGWLDPDLTELGVQECITAAQVLLAEGFDNPDVVYTSRLKRAIKSTWVILEQLNSLYIPVYKTYRLNPRMYGALQGLSKAETIQRVGINTVNAWRTTLKAKPPKLDDNDERNPKNDRRYSDLATDEIPSTESLLECQNRASSLWEYKVKRDLQKGKTVFVIAHQDSMLGIMKSIDSIDNAQILDVSIPQSIPFVYRFDKEMNPINANKESDEGDKKKKNKGTKAVEVHHMSSASFLQDPDKVLSAITKQQERYNNMYLKIDHNNRHHHRTTSLKQSLSMLRQDHNLTSSSSSVNKIPVIETKNATSNIAVLEDSGNWIDDNINDFDEFDFDHDTFNEGSWADDPAEFEEYDDFGDEESSDIHKHAPVNIVSMPGTTSSKSLDLGVTSSSSTSTQHSGENEVEEEYLKLLPPPKQDEAFVVLIRHGRTPHNNLGLFTGWEDPPLAEGGVEDARNAGRLLKRHNFQFDVVYTSWLTRAIQTAYYALDELDCVWLPIVKSWRLNERMYGALTGKSKKMIANEYGEDQLKKWRRGFAIQPPPISSYSPNYPGNDMKRTKHFKDLPFSFRETISRSLEERKFVLHRKFPKTESLKDCMSRSIPFYTERIRQDAIDKGKRVLITSHENAIRGILMHLCDIPPEAMNQLHLPNGLPLVYNIKGKCITLLDDGSGRDPLEVHDFGPAAKYLFKPCEISGDFYDSMLLKEKKP